MDPSSIHPSMMTTSYHNTVISCLVSSCSLTYVVYPTVCSPAGGGGGGGWWCCCCCYCSAGAVSAMMGREEGCCVCEMVQTVRKEQGSGCRGAEERLQRGRGGEDGGKRNSNPELNTPSTPHIDNDSDSDNDKCGKGRQGRKPLIFSSARLCVFLRAAAAASTSLPITSIPNSDRTGWRFLHPSLGSACSHAHSLAGGLLVRWRICILHVAASPSTHPAASASLGHPPI